LLTCFLSFFFFFFLFLFSFPVNIHYVLGRNTFDDNMWPIISRKLESIGRAVSGQALSMNIGLFSHTFAQQLAIDIMG